MEIGSGTTWVMDGANAAMSGTRGIAVQGGQFTLNDGNADLTDNGKDTQASGASSILTINGGTMMVGRNLNLRNDATFTINGGTLLIAGSFVGPSFASPAEAIEFNGGETTAVSFNFETPNTVTFGGSKVGSLSLTDGLGDGATMNWLFGSQMTMTVATVDEWAAAEWAVGRLTYKGQSNIDLGKTWTEVTAADGLEPGVRFGYDSVAETLSLVMEDGDGDGIADSWETTHFGGNFITDGTSDSDGDGVIDFFEYLYDSAPTDSSSRGFHLAAEEDILDNQTHLDWQTAPGFELETHYVIEVSTDLINWDKLPTAHYIHSADAVGDKLQNEVTIIHDYGTHVFVRLIAP